jgi:hypothetical protein
MSRLTGAFAPIFASRFVAAAWRPAFFFFG